MTLPVIYLILGLITALICTAVGVWKMDKLIRTCGWCGEKFETREAARVHARECNKNPVVKELFEARYRRACAERELRDLNEESESFSRGTRLFSVTFEENKRLKKELKEARKGPSMTVFIANYENKRMIRMRRQGWRPIKHPKQGWNKMCEENRRMRDALADLLYDKAQEEQHIRPTGMTAAESERK